MSSCQKTPTTASSLQLLWALAHFGPFYIKPVKYSGFFFFFYLVYVTCRKQDLVWMPYQFICCGSSWSRGHIISSCVWMDDSSSPTELLQILKNVLQDCMSNHQKPVAKKKTLKKIWINGFFLIFLWLVLNVTIYFQKYSIIRKLIKLLQWLPKESNCRVSLEAKPKEFLINEEHRKHSDWCL